MTKDNFYDTPNTQTSTLSTATAKDIAQDTGKNAKKECLVHVTKYQSVVPICKHLAETLMVFVIHLAQLPF